MSGFDSFTMSRRNLPHWQDPGSVYFVTWRTANSIDLFPEERTIVLNAIRYWDGLRWTLYSAVVMSDHLHVLARPLPKLEQKPVSYYELGLILHSVKSYSSHQINKRRQRSGAIWQDERYDRIIRDEEEFWEKWQYIRDNPVKENLSSTTEKYPWYYQTNRGDE